MAKQRQGVDIPRAIMKNLTIPIDLLNKYGKSGPRYTSYPPAPVWTKEIGEKEWEGVKIRSSQSTDPISFYIHLPFCAKRCLFCGCNVLITQKEEVLSEYVDLLESEFERLAPSIEGRKVAQLHLGGGSPSFMPPAMLARMMDFIRKRLQFEDGAEIAIEVNPEQVDDHLIRVLRANGFNRVSLGVQDLDETVQKSIGRVCTFSKIYESVEKIREIDTVKAINLDLIYGLPNQTEKSLDATLHKILFLRPERLAVYPYAHVPWIRPQQRQFESESLPGPSLKSRLWCDMVKTFSNNEYQLVGMDHFCLESDELVQALHNGSLHRNFMGYTTRKGLDLFGIGLTSISSVEEGYFQNETKLSGYRKAVAAKRSPIEKGYLFQGEDLLRREVIMNTLVRGEIDYAEIENNFSIDFQTHFHTSLEALKDMESDGLLEFSSGGFKATPAGMYFLRNIAMVFDETYQAVQVEGKPMYSQTV